MQQGVVENMVGNDATSCGGSSAAGSSANELRLMVTQENPGKQQQCS